MPQLNCIAPSYIVNPAGFYGTYTILWLYFLNLWEAVRIEGYEGQIAIPIPSQLDRWNGVQHHLENNQIFSILRISPVQAKKVSWQRRSSTSNNLLIMKTDTSTLPLVLLWYVSSYVPPISGDFIPTCSLDLFPQTIHFQPRSCYCKFPTQPIC